MYTSIGFIGTGNMGGALAQAVSMSGSDARILLANRSREKAERLAADLGASVSDNQTIASSCDLIFLGVKPQLMRGMLEEIAPMLRGDTTLCTMAAGLSCSAIREMSGGVPKIIRIMPNTPVSIGHGVIPYTGDGVGEEELNAFCQLLAPAGVLVPMAEHLIDAASAVSGCGPAYAYLFAEALADGGVACGLPRADALRLAAGMLEGAAALMLQSGKHPGELKDAVTSPGGTTIQGVRALEEHGFRGAVMDAVIAAYEKTLSLKK